MIILSYIVEDEQSSVFFPINDIKCYTYMRVCMYTNCFYIELKYLILQIKTFRLMIKGYLKLVRFNMILVPMYIGVRKNKKHQNARACWELFDAGKQHLGL